MPRYFFDIHDQTDVVDVDGIELVDLAAARSEAAQALAESALELLSQSDPSMDLSIDVRDQTRAIVLRARLVLSIEPEF